jgi:hypothetical protein
MKENIMPGREYSEYLSEYEQKKADNLRKQVKNTIMATISSLAEEGKVIVIEQLNIVVNDATSVELTIPPKESKG